MRSSSTEDALNALAAHHVVSFVIAAAGPLHEAHCVAEVY